MAGAVYSLVPRPVKRIETPYRRIVTDWPVPESVEVIERLRKYEPISMSGQPPVVWDRAEDFQVYDAWGNMWLDFSSGVLVTNAGHAPRTVREAIIGQVEHGLLHNYCFPSRLRADLAQKLVEITPDGLDKAFILTTGSEATENAIKLARTYGQKLGGSRKIGLVTFEHGFHGRTLGAQMAGGIPNAKQWIGAMPPGFYNVPFPDGFRCEDTRFELFLESLDAQGVSPDEVCGVMTETYQGGGASFAPKEYIQQLARWCDKHNVLLIFDEVQAGFGRTGRMFGFEHYDTVPDLMCCGKGISGSLPLSAVIGRADVMDLYGPREMTSTHTGNPVCVAAALASIERIETQGLVRNAERVGNALGQALRGIQARHPDVIGAVHGKGLVYGLHVVKPGGKEPDGPLAFDIVGRCAEKGLLMFAPVGFGGATVKIAPPLTITLDAALDGAEALQEAIAEAREAH